MTASDIKTLIGEVAARHGVTLRPDDPAFVGFVIGPCRLSLMEVHVSPNTWVLPFRKCEVSDAGCAVLGR